jgi:GDP-4-dehydro-6-deoxy-D-mannose reductase
VYGAGRGARARTERDPLLPVSPYAASKVGAEVAAFETRRRTGLPVVVARPFPHTGPGQAEAFVAPAFAGRLREARASGAASVRTGSLQPVRDFSDVRDVAAAYLLLLQRGEPGEAYNVASGTGTPLHELFTTLAGLVGTAAVPEVDPALVRTADVPHLVGDATKLRERTGWVPRVPLLQTLRDLVDAQAH